MRLSWHERQKALIGTAIALDSENQIVAGLRDVVFKQVSKTQFTEALSNRKKSITVNKNSVKDSVLEMKVEDELRSSILQLLSVHTGIPKDEVQGEQTLEELGVDSLLLIELIGHLENLIGKEAAAIVGERISYTDTVDTLADTCIPNILVEQESGTFVTRFGKLIQGQTQEQTVRPPVLPTDQNTRDLEAKVLQILAEILGSSVSVLESKGNVSLYELGLDSLGAIELNEGLDARLGIAHKDPETYISCESVSDFVKLATGIVPQPHQEQPLPLSDSILVPETLQKIPLENMKSQAAAAAAADIYSTLKPGDVAMLQKALKMESNPLLIRRGAQSGLTPIFIVADGSGIAATVMTIPSVQKRDIWILSHKGYFETPRLDFGIVEHAAALISDIDCVYSYSPIILAGWSFGGILAWEMAYQMRQLHRRNVLGVIAIDSPCPYGHVPLDDSILQHLIPTNYKLTGVNPATERRLKLVRELMRSSFMKSGRAIAQYAKLSETDAGQATAMRNALQSPNACNLPVILLRSTDDYRGSPSQQNVLTKSPCFDWLTNRNSSQAFKLLGWEKMGSTLKSCYDIPGSHFTPFAKRNVRTAIKVLYKC